MTLDVKAFFLAGAPIAFLCGLLQLAFWLRDRQQTAVILWATGDFVGVIGALLVVARDRIPWWISSALANSLIIGASLFIWAGMLRFSRMRIPITAFVMATVAFFAVFQTLWFFSQDLGLRVLITSVALAVVNAGVAIDLIRGQLQKPLWTRQLLASVFALHALFYLFRSATAVTLEAGDEFLRSGGIQNVALAIGVVKLIAWNIIVLGMLREGARSPALAAA